MSRAAARQISYLERALALRERLGEGGSIYFQMWARPDLARALAETERIAEARQHVEWCREVLGGGEDWRGRAGHVALADAIVLSGEGKGAEADAAFERALEVLDRYRLRGDAAEAMGHWGRALVRAGDAAGATDRFDAAADLFRRYGAGEPYVAAVAADRAALSGA